MGAEFSALEAEGGLALSASSPQPPPFLPLVPGPLPLFSTSSCQWVDISELLPTQNPLQCLLSRWGQWAQLVVCGTAEGQGRYWLTQDRQVLLQLLSRPAQSTLDAVAMSPGGFSCFSLFNLAAVEARATAPVSVSGPSGPG